MLYVYIYMWRLKVVSLPRGGWWGHTHTQIGKSIFYSFHFTNKYTFCYVHCAKTSPFSKKNEPPKNVCVCLQSHCTRLIMGTSTQDDFLMKIGKSDKKKQIQPIHTKHKTQKYLLMTIVLIFSHPFKSVAFYLSKYKLRKKRSFPSLLVCCMG